MPIIYLVGFRGVSRHDESYKDEVLPIKLGHIGIYFEGDETIYGFHPMSDEIDKAGGDDKFIDQLIAHIPKDGKIFDDTEIFRRAYELAQQGARCRVWKTPYEYDGDEFHRIRKSFLRAYENGDIFPYNFPPLEGSMTDDYDNCATFPRKFSIHIPEQSGVLKQYLVALYEAGGEPWIPDRM